jgi:5-dehydro-2-deoxygluconokinase
MIASGEDNLLGGAESDPLAVTGRRSCSSAAPRAASSMTARSRDDLEDGIVGTAFRSRSTTCSARATRSCPASCAAGCAARPHATSATWANACGAFAVSRLLCSPEYPTWDELSYFLKHGSKHRALRKDEDINHIHWATTRRAKYRAMMALAIDHRMQLLDRRRTASGADPARIPDFKVLAVKAAAQVSQGRPGYGMLLDEKYGREAMFEAAKHKFDWIGRPWSCPARVRCDSNSARTSARNSSNGRSSHCIKCLCFYHPDDPAELKLEQQEKLRTLFDASRKVGRELLIEIIAGKHGKLDDRHHRRALTELYDLGIKPDWWKLEPQASVTAWRNIEAVIAARDPFCRGVVLLGLEAPQQELERLSPRTAKSASSRVLRRPHDFCRCRRKLAGRPITDEAAIDRHGRAL